MSECELWWLAGLLEGEGYFAAHTTYDKRRSNPEPYIYLRIQVTSCDLDVLTAMQNITGVGSVLGPWKTRKKNHTPTYHWQVVRRNDVEHLMELLYPLMSIRRKKQIKKALNTFRARS